MKRSKFSLSHYKLLSARMGELVPCGLVEVLPGDTVQHATSLLLRTMPLNAPVMHPVNCKVHHWFVPHRLVWDAWEDFITGGPDGEDASVFPTIAMPASTGAAVGSLADYLGVPTGVADLAVSALPFRGYQMIFNEWYRDQDLVTESAISTASGADSTTSTALKRAAWEKDYFTSARPFETKGPDITISIGDEAPVDFGTGYIDLLFQSDGTAAQTAQDQADPGTNTIGRGLAKAPTVPAPGSAGLGVSRSQFTGVTADLSEATPISINTLREAFAMQRYQEARARYGSRYTEYLRYLGVRSSDARLQRPEYLGGGKQTIQFSEVLQTAEGENPVGEMRGHGISAMRSNRYRRFFEEHGYVFSFITVRPKTIYGQGLARTWNRRTKEDFWQVELQHIGQQEVLYKELYAPHATPDARFGYQDRYDEYRRMESSIAGEFRESILDFWHMARLFETDPALNSDFVTCTPTERIFPVDTNDTLYIMANHSIQARRLVARTGNSFIF